MKVLNKTDPVTAEASAQCFWTTKSRRGKDRKSEKEEKKKTVRVMQRVDV